MAAMAILITGSNGSDDYQLPPASPGPELPTKVTHDFALKACNPSAMVDPHLRYMHVMAQANEKLWAQIRDISFTMAHRRRIRILDSSSQEDLTETSELIELITGFLDTLIVPSIMDSIPRDKNMKLKGAQDKQYEFKDFKYPAMQERYLTCATEAATLKQRLIHFRDLYTQQLQNGGATDAKYQFRKGCGDSCDSMLAYADYNCVQKYYKYTSKWIKKRQWQYYREGATTREGIVKEAPAQIDWMSTYGQFAIMNGKGKWVHVMFPQAQAMPEYPKPISKPEAFCAWFGRKK